ncbi:MAG: hypothetical protein RL398_781 [Planctomycetota bacterium]|jgi:hypothetical protein
MGAKTILVLLALIGGLLLVLRFTDRTVPVAVSQETSLLDGRSLQEALRIRWEFHARQPIELTRGADGMLALAEPIRDRVSQGYLRQICDAWDSAKLQRTPLADDAVGRQKAGLAPALLKFTVWWGEGEPLEIEIGDPTPLGNGRFVRRSGALWEGGEGLVTSLEVGLEDLRDRSVFRTEPANCRSLTVTQALAGEARETVTLARQGVDWRLTAPFEGRADGDAAVAYVTAVLALRVGDFVHGMVRLPEREPEIVVTAVGGFGEESVRLWLQDGSIFGLLPGRDIVFVSDNRQYNQVFINAAERLRARLLLPMRSVAQELGEAAIDFGGAGDRTRLLRDGIAEDWRLVEPVAHATHPTPINELMQALNNLHARRFADGMTAETAACGLGPGRLMITVRALEKRELTTLWIGNEVQVGDERLAYACRADEPGQVVMVPGPAVDVLRRAWPSYCALQVIDVRAPVERLELQGRSGPIRAFVLGKLGWTKEGSDQPLEELAGLVEDQLRDLRAQRAVDLRDKSFGDPDWVLSLRRANGDSFAAIRLWDRGAQAPLVAQPSGEAAVGYELSGFLAKNLRELWQ